MKEDNFTDLLKKDRIKHNKTSLENQIAKKLFESLLESIVQLNRSNKRSLVYKIPLFIKDHPVFDRLVVFSKLIKKFKQKKLNIEYQKESIDFTLTISW